MRRALVLGGYGLIGSACMRALAAAGYRVTGVGRSRRSAMAADPPGDWIIRDIPSIAPEEWREILHDVDVVVNAAGALQDGARDDLEAIHVTAIDRLAEALAGTPVRLVQISAAGVSATASTEFFRSKARGDAIVASRAEGWVILRPTLVLSREAYGGTALLRAAAALPACLPKVLPGAQIQTVFVEDLAAAVVTAANGNVPSGTIADLTEHEARSLPEVMADMRRWLGLPAPAFAPQVPDILLALAAGLADLLGYLGWRSPLRTTALRALRDGVSGDPNDWEAIGGAPCRGFAETLAAMPATRQERLFAQAYFILPLAIGTLALFWTVSGLVALADVPRATMVLEASSLPSWLADTAVVGGAVADILVGAAILWRPWVRRAALGMVALSLAYLAGGLFLAPELWSDPLGPMVKVLPGIVLAVVVCLLMEER